MSQAKMQAARELIQEGKLTEARAILVTVSHPKAREWIGKIDQRLAANQVPTTTYYQSPTPPRSVPMNTQIPAQPTFYTPPIQTKKPPPSLIRVLTILILVLVFGLVIWGNMAGSGRNSTPLGAFQATDAPAETELGRTQRIAQQYLGQNFTVSIFDDEVIFYAAWDALPAPNTPARTRLNQALVGLMCNLYSEGLLSGRGFSIDVAYGAVANNSRIPMADIVLIITVPNYAISNPDCSNQASFNLEQRASDYIWADD